MARLGADLLRSDPEDRSDEPRAGGPLPDRPRRLTLTVPLEPDPTLPEANRPGDTPAARGRRRLPRAASVMDGALARIDVARSASRRIRIKLGSRAIQGGDDDPSMSLWAEGW